MVIWVLSILVIPEMSDYVLEKLEQTEICPPDNKFVSSIRRKGCNCVHVAHIYLYVCIVDIATGIIRGSGCLVLHERCWKMTGSSLNFSSKQTGGFGKEKKGTIR